MRIGIDATNLRSGGSLTHIEELLTAARPERHGISQVTIWAGREVLSRLPSRSWLEAVYAPMLDRPLPLRVLWQQTRLASLARRHGCEILFVPSGTYLGDFRPYVTMSRNMLPYDGGQMRLYGGSPMLLKLLILRLGQSSTVRRAEGTIFLNGYARARVIKSVQTLTGRETIIPHGISPRFQNAPRKQKPLAAYSKEEPFKLLYVSTVDAYKYQWCVAEAVGALAASGLPVTLDLVGPAHHPSIQRLCETVRRLGIEDVVRYRGSVPYHDLPAVYAASDAFVFASSCENLPNCLLEAMCAGLPIACSNRPPMPDILGDGGVYFDPADTDDTLRALHHLVTSPHARDRYAAAAHARARMYSWERCADETFSFLRALV